MLDPFSPRGAMTRAAFAIVIAFLAASVGSRNGNASAADCGPMAATQNVVTALGGHELTPLSEGRAATLRMILTPDSDADEGDVLTSRMLASGMDNGRMAIVFARDDRACGLILLPEGTAAMLDALQRVGGLPGGETL